MIQRHLENMLVRALLTQRKVLVMLGPRQVGKTTLLKQVISQLSGKIEVLNGDFLDDRNLLKTERAYLERLVSGLDYLIIDEAQNIENIGQVLKLIHDTYPDVRVVATGSSSFDLRHNMGEPLTGRQIQLILYPIAYSELNPGLTEKETVIQHGLIYGNYPEAITIKTKSEKQDYLRQLASDYILRDIYRQVEVNSHKLNAILRLLALQIGSEVSLSEIARSVQLDVKTVARYLQILEDAFVIFRIHGFSKNLRKEISKSSKVYFWDLGLRNALIDDFRELDSRRDLGGIWENYLFSERIKFNAYRGLHVKYYFWRTYDQQEIDMIEESANMLSAYEFKLSERKRAKIPRIWQQTYPDSKTAIISRDNVESFIASNK